MAGGSKEAVDTQVLEVMVIALPLIACHVDLANPHGDAFCGLLDCHPLDNLREPLPRSVGVFERTFTEIIIGARVQEESIDVTANFFLIDGVLRTLALLLWVILVECTGALGRCT